MSTEFEMSRRKSPTVGTCHDSSEFDSVSEDEGDAFDVGVSRLEAGLNAVGGLSGLRRIAPTV